MSCCLAQISRKCITGVILALGPHTGIASAATASATTASATTASATTASATSAAAEAPPEHRVALTTNLVTPFFGAYLLEGTARLSGSWGLLASASYLSLENPKDQAWRTYAGTIAAGLDYYLPLGAPRRAYLEAVGEMVFSSWHHQPSGQVAPLVIGSTAIALVGYRYIWPRGPVLDVGVGVVAIHFPGARVELANGASTSSAAFTN